MSSVLIIVRIGSDESRGLTECNDWLVGRGEACYLIFSLSPRSAVLSRRISPKLTFWCILGCSIIGFVQEWVGFWEDFGIIKYLRKKCIQNLSNIGDMRLSFSTELEQSEAKQFGFGFEFGGKI